jgi:DNA-nicking Smr family endonuclease
MLRGMTVEAALDRLERFVRQHRSHGTRELLLIVGKGSRSPSGESILAPAVREFCEQRPALVRGIRDAPDHEGGSGAWIVELELG